MSSVSGGPLPNLIGASPTAAASLRPISALAKIAGKIAAGLSSIFKRMDTEQASFGPQFGVRFASKAAPGTTLNGYRVLGDKAKGVEPGFTALKDWHPTDDDKLQQPGHALHSAGRDWVAGQLLTNLGAERAQLVLALQKGMATLTNEGDLSAGQAAMVKGMGNLSDPTALLRCPDRQLVRDIAQHALGEIMAQRDSAEGAPLYQSLKDHLMETQLQFTEKHYIKLDYYEANKSLAGNYTIPYSKTKAILSMPVVGKLLHKLGKSISPREINQGAVNEKLANDLMGVLGMKTQTLDLVKATYADGTPKLMLDSTHIQDFNDFDGEKNATKGSVYIQHGVLVKNSRLPTDPPGEFNGPPQLHAGIEELGDKKVMLLLLADRDALGSKGGNKGYVDNQFFAIDPGHALEEKLLSKRGDVKSDLSFDPASAIGPKDYKNFSIFDQSTFAQKMEGVRKLQQLQGHDSALFDEYAKQYGPENGSKALDFRDQLLTTQAQYIGRRNDILQTFSSRLAVDNYRFGDEIDNNPELKRNHRDQTLNLLDGLEKLTSTTVGRAGGKKDGVRLNIPQVLKPADRKAWDVQQNGNYIVFSFQGKPAEARKMLETLRDFCRQTGVQSLPDFETDGAGAITLSVPRDQILQAQSALGYSQIMQYKHG
jgi:hypothetical protein